jgi:hypothetical protein
VSLSPYMLLYVTSGCELTNQSHSRASACQLLRRARLSQVSVSGSRTDSEGCRVRVDEPEPLERVRVPVAARRAHARSCRVYVRGLPIMSGLEAKAGAVPA